jgi:hypothetical protein
VDTLCHTSCRSGTIRPNKAGFLLYEGKGPTIKTFRCCGFLFLFWFWFGSGFTLGQVFVDFESELWTCKAVSSQFSFFRAGIFFFGLALGQVFVNFKDPLDLVWLQGRSLWTCKDKKRLWYIVTFVVLDPDFFGLGLAKTKDWTSDGGLGYDFFWLCKHSFSGQRMIQYQLHLCKTLLGAVFSVF